MLKWIRNLACLKWIFIHFICRLLIPSFSLGTLWFCIKRVRYLTFFLGYGRFGFYRAFLMALWNIIFGRKWIATFWFIIIILILLYFNFTFILSKCKWIILCFKWIWYIIFKETLLILLLSLEWIRYWWITWFFLILRFIFNLLKLIHCFN